MLVRTRAAWGTTVITELMISFADSTTAMIDGTESAGNFSDRTRNTNARTTASTAISVLAKHHPRHGRKGPYHTIPITRMTKREVSVAATRQRPPVRENETIRQTPGYYRIRPHRCVEIENSSSEDLKLWKHMLELSNGDKIVLMAEVDRR